MAIDYGNLDAISNLAICYISIEKNYEQAKKYFHMGIEKDDLFSMLHLGFYYFLTEKDYNEAKKYYKLGIDKYNSSLIDIFHTYHENNEFELYKFYTLIETTNSVINEKIKELTKKNKNISDFNNKKRLFTELNNYKQCIICLCDNVLNIKLNCGHDICIDCYDPNMKCYYNFC